MQLYIQSWMELCWRVHYVTNLCSSTILVIKAEKEKKKKDSLQRVTCNPSPCWLLDCKLTAKDVVYTL